MKNRYFKKGLINIFITLLSLLVISCASGPGGDDEEVESVSLSAGSESIVADGTTGTLITATVKNTNGENAEGTTVTFTTTAGTLSALSAKTVNGIATVTLTSPVNVGSASITGTSKGVNSSTTVNLIPGPVTNVKLTITPSNLTADGASESTIRAEVTDFYNNAVADGETISFSVTTGSGILSAPTATTSGGVATVTYTASDTPGVEGIRAEATNGTFSTAIINLIAAFVGSVELTAGCDTIPADGITGTQISATIKDTNGNNVPDGTTVDFSATAGRLSAPSAPTTNGVAIVTITSSTNVGTAVIIGTSGGVNGNTSVSFIPGAVMNVALNATPNNISSDGTSTSTIRAEVTDFYNNAVADGETISFSVTTGTGTLSAPTATTTGGVAVVTYTASHTAGIETVTAETANGSSTTANITLITASIGSVDANAGSENVTADGVSGTLITADVKDTNGDKIADGTPVSFTTTAGSLSAPTATTTNGIATVTLTSPTNVGSASIIATSGGVNGSAAVNFIPGPVTNITLTATPNNLSSDGTSTSTIRAEVTDFYNNAVADGQIISFSVTTGTGILSAPTATTIGGVAVVTYTASTTPGAEVMQAEATNGVFSTATITLIAASIGSVDANAGSENVTADGVSGTLITATVQDTNGNNVPNGTSVSFTTTAGTLSAPTATTTNGIATVTLTSPTNVGSANIIATSGGVNGSTSVNFIPGQVTNVTLAATPNNLTADGTSTSTIRAEVTDAQGNAMDGETISFSVTRGTGTLSAPTATTSGGVATVTYSASNNPGSEIIRAEATNGTFSTVTINLIYASVGSVEVEAGCDTIPADGSTSTLITATVKDTNDNNVPDGTLVNFTTTAGNLSATGATTTNGVATINITSSTNLGTATIIATSGGVNANITVEFIAGSITTVALTATPNNLTADGTSTSTIRAEVTDSNNNAVDGETISFSVTTGTGTLSAPTAITSGGVAVVTYTASTTAGTEVIRAETTNGTFYTVNINLIIVSSVTLASNSTTGAIADGTDSYSITAQVLDPSGQPINNQGVAFAFTGNTGLVAISPPVTATTDNGTATCSVTDISAENDTVNITASSGGKFSSPISLHFSVPTGQTVPASFSLSTSQISVKSDNSDSATITATVLDEKNAVIEDVIVGFMASGGQLSSSSAATDSNGQAQVIFSSGSVDRSNKVVTIEASVIGLPNTQIPIQILGSTLTISADNTTITEDGSTTAALTIAAKDAGGNPVYNTPIALSITGGGGATLSEYSGFTDLSGKFNVILTGTAMGTVTVQADGLGATATQDFEIISTGGVFFEITSPATDTVSLGTGDDLTVTVSAPAPTTRVVFSTSFGAWDGGTSAVVTKDVSSGTASAVFNSTLAGVATLQVHDEADDSRRDSVNVAVSAPSADAAYITLQSNTTVVPLSVGAIEHTATLTASVRTSSASGQQPVGGAAVIFSIENQTGGGETIFPVISYTNASGIATTTFTSGSLSSGAEGVVINARVLGKGTTGELTSISFNNSNPDTIKRSDIGSFIIDGFKEGEQIRVQGSQQNDGYYIIDQVADDTLTLDPGDNLTGEAEGKSITIAAVTTSVNIVIGGTAGSIVIGRGSKIEVLSPTTYSLPMSVLVADSNGNPVAGAIVSLNTWPGYYSTGYWGPNFDVNPDTGWITWRDECTYYLTGTYENEDANENLFLDPGEDYGTDPGNGDGQLTPPNSAAGTIPMTVTTDDNGVASFNLVYMKSSAIWITDRIRASTLVMGTETTSSMTFRLPAERDEAEACELPESPYNKELPVGHINLTSEENTLTANGLSTSAISAVVTDTEGKPVSGEVVTLEVTTGTGVLSAPTATTDGNGVISVTYTASTTPGTETITASTANGTYAAVDIILVAPLIGSLDLTAGCDTIPADGTTSTIITATVKDTNGNNVPDGTRVDFTTTAGSLSIPTTTTNGIATVYITSSTNLGTATIIATSGGVNANVTVEFIAGPVTIVTLTATPNNLTADGSSTSTIRATVLDINNNPVSHERISFNTGNGSLSAASSITDDSGIATVTYTASTAAGIATIIGESTNGTGSTVNITLIATSIGSVDLTAGSENIVADGVSNTLITATVKDTNGNHVPNGTSVSFTTTAGSLSAPTGTTTNGIATVYITSSTNLGTATITATSGGVNADVTVEFITGPVTTVTLTATPNNLTADGSSTSTIRATVLDINNNPVSHERISFNTGNGSLSAASSITDENGIATVTYTASTTTGIATIAAEATNGVSNTVTITLIAASIGSVEVSAGSENIVADGLSSTIITATVKDTNGNNVSDGTSVSFITTAGSLSSPTATTTNGIATVTLTSPTNIGSATITATSGGMNAYTTVDFIAGPPATITVIATPNNLSADSKSTSTIRAEVKDAHGNAVANGETISFSVIQGTGTLSPSTAKTSDGIATVTYTASAAPGAEIVEAEATNGVSNTVTITLIAASIGSVEVSAGSENIVADGLSSTIITATVKDTNGNNVSDGTSVSFITTAGSLSSPTATTTNGIATVTLTSPTNIGSATITATSGGMNAYTTVDFIAGPPATITVIATPNNLSADSKSTSTIRAEVKDAHGNAVANGETISFSVIQGTGTLSPSTAKTSDGIATVTYTASAAPGAEIVEAEATNGVSNTVTITLIAASIGSVEVSAGSENIVADGLSSTIITATVKDTNGNNVSDGTSVSFITTAGSLSSPTATTTNGIATVTLTSPTNIGSATITATSGGMNAYTTVDFIAGPPATITVIATPNNLSADSKSTSTIRAEVKDAHGNAVANGETISFSVIQGTGTLSPSTAKTSDGIATVTYTASAAPGAEIVEAEATNGVSNTVTITLIAASIGSVEVSAGSENIVADGLSSTIITATVKDTNGNNVSDGTSVSFITTAGSLSSPTATTTNGIATVTLTSPTNIGSATITATSGGMNAYTTVDFIAGPPATITVIATPNSLLADGESTSTIRAEVKDAHGNAVANGETISFSVIQGTGTLSPSTAKTSDGIATVTYTASAAPGAEIVEAEATNGVSSTTTLSLIGPQIASIELEAEPSSLPADGFSQSVIRATLAMVGGGDAPDGTPVYFTKIEGGGEINPASPTYATTAGGVALAFLTSGTTSEIAKIRAEAGGRTAEIEVEYTPGSVTLTIIPNSLLGTGLETAAVTAVLKDALGSPPPQGQSVTFTLDDMTLGEVIPVSTTSNAQGEATTTFQTSGKGGTVTVTATWNTGGINVTGSETIDMQPPPAFIEVADGSPNPASINIKGTGGQSTSQITFNVKDTHGNLVADGYRLDFTIDSGPNGGEDIIPPFGITHDGQVSTILYSGFKSGPVSIKATYYHDTNISTTTSQIAINAGPPVGEEFGIFAEYLNISGLWMANLEDQISVNAADMYGNAIPDNTAISFKTYNTGGFFTPNTATTTGGLATNTLHSGGTYLQPLQGFVSVTGEAINGGRTTHITSLAITPAPYNNIIYAGTNGGGVYKSIDSGATWTNISRSTENPKYGQNWIDPHVKGNSAICIDPDDNQKVYVGTGYLGRGNVYRSLDGGMNWNSNNVEEWHGIYGTNQAVLTVLCDGGGSDYVWIGTEGLGALFAPDGENFNSGGIVNPVGPTVGTPCNGETCYVNPANIGNGLMTKPGLSCSSNTETWTATYQKTGSEISTTPILTSPGGADGTMTNISSEAAETENWTITYKGGSNVPSGGGGQGTLTVISTSANTQTETWSITCIDGTDDSEVFRVRGSESGFHAQLSDITQNYTSDNQEVSFYIEQTGDFTGGEIFTFNTTQDGWTVVGVKSGVKQDARTDTPYTSNLNEVSFTVNSGTNKFYKQGDFWQFDTKITGNWVLSGTVSNYQAKRAQNNIEYHSDNNEVAFTIFEGSTSFEVGDIFEFNTTANGLDCGKVVRDMVKVPSTHGDSATLYAATNTGVFKSINGGQIWTVTGQFAGDFINTLSIHPTSASTIYAGTEDAGFWVSADSGTTWNSFNDGMGGGLSATMPIANRDNQGNGVMGNVGVGPDTQSEYWSVTCIAEAPDSGTFSVTGTVSEPQPQANTATVGTLYTSDNGEISFTISDGSIDFKTGDTFTFSTTRDPGRKIKDLLVDQNHAKLYAVTYFWGPLEPHAVGNVYVHGINGDGSMTGGPWVEANANLPQYDPPDDTTLFAQHVIAPDVPGNPTALYVGGEGINLYKATSGIDTGDPVWNQSKSGLTNLIMARMPILFTGQCPMVITPEVDGNNVTFTVYIQDSNGNPPIVGSTFKVTLKRGEDTFTLRDITYPDTYTYQGTWRDPADVTTNNPYTFTLTPLFGDELTFTYQPTCGDEAPGCSGSDQEVSYSF